MRWLSGDRPGADRAGVVTGPWSMAVLSRWALSIGIAAAVLYGSAGPARPWPHGVFVLAVLLTNGLLGWQWRRIESRGLLSAIVGLDVLVVTAAIAFTGQASADLYLFYFLVLLAAATVHSWRGFVAVSLATCAVYGALLYADLGSRLWHESSLLLRIPFLLSVSIFVGLAAQHVRRERDALDRIGRALTEIGRLGVSWGSTGSVLHDIARQVQETLGIDRCSLILIEDDFRSGYLAASGDDPHAETRMLPIEQYPEIMEAIETHEVVELYPDDPPELWEQVTDHLPEASGFSSFLIVPVSLREELLGVYFLRSRDPQRRFEPRERTFCRVVAMMTATFVHERELQRQLASRPRPTGARTDAAVAAG